jgi:hypothetical protein
MSFQDILYSKQAELITKLNSDVYNLKKENEMLHNRLQRKTRAEKYYLTLEKLVGENVILESDWNRFLTLVKLSIDEEDMKDLK